MPAWIDGTGGQHWLPLPTSSTKIPTWVPRVIWSSVDTGTATAGSWYPITTATATTTTVTAASTTTGVWWYYENDAVWSTTDATHDRVIYRPVAPAIHRVSEQELMERDQAAYRKALTEHDDQEAQRLLRQIAERERVAAERQLAIVQSREAAERLAAQRAEAKERAREFLLSHLNPSQKETFEKNGWFVVEGGRSKTKYRIRAVDSMVANVDVLDQDKLRHRLCAHVPTHKVPLGDQLLAQKMMLEFSEDDFLRIANRH